jgi:hypothetical protein
MGENPDSAEGRLVPRPVATPDNHAIRRVVVDFGLHYRKRLEYVMGIMLVMVLALCVVLFWNVVAPFTESSVTMGFVLFNLVCITWLTIRALRHASQANKQFYKHKEVLLRVLMSRRQAMAGMPSIDRYPKAASSSSRFRRNSSSVATSAMDDVKQEYLFSSGQQQEELEQETKRTAPSLNVQQQERLQQTCNLLESAVRVLEIQQKNTPITVLGIEATSSLWRTVLTIALSGVASFYRIIQTGRNG